MNISRRTALKTSAAAVAISAFPHVKRHENIDIEVYPVSCTFVAIPGSLLSFSDAFRDNNFHELFLPQKYYNYRHYVSFKRNSMHFCQAEPGPRTKIGLINNMMEELCLKNQSPLYIEHDEYHYHVNLKSYTYIDNYEYLDYEPKRFLNVEFDILNKFPNKYYKFRVQYPDGDIRVGADRGISYEYAEKHAVRYYPKGSKILQMEEMGTLKKYSYKIKTWYGEIKEGTQLGLNLEHAKKIVGQFFSRSTALSFKQV